MPIYEYQCEKCGGTIEVLQKFSDSPLETCPSCGGGVSKLMSTNSFQLKGSGWYVTDYKGKADSSSKPAASAKETPAAKTNECSTSGAKECASCPSAAKTAE